MFRLKEDFICTASLIGKWVVFAAGPLVLWANLAIALGTSAGTAITNTVTVDYTLGSDPTARTSMASDAFSVVEIIDVAVTWQDGANVPVNSPHAGAVLTFQVVNTGNGPENFRISVDHNIPGDDFNPSAAVPTTLWLESNGTIGLQTSGASPDAALVIGGSISLNADETALIYVLSDIPGSLSDTRIGLTVLAADAATPGAAGAAAGTELPGAGVGGDAVVGSTNADGGAQGTYEVSAPRVALSKSIVQMLDPYGGNQPYTGAQVTYRIQVDVTGSGMAETLVITDFIPVNTTYVPDSIRLDGFSQSDTDDAPADNTDFNVTTPNAVTVNFGDLVAPATRYIEFSVTIE